MAVSASAPALSGKRSIRRTAAGLTAWFSAGSNLDVVVPDGCAAAPTTHSWEARTRTYAFVRFSETEGFVIGRTLRTHAARRIPYSEFGIGTVRHKVRPLLPRTKKEYVMNRRSFLAPLMAVAMVTAPMLVSVPAAAAPPTGTGLVTSIMQTIPNVGTFTGTLTTTGFTLANGIISATGTLSGTFTPIVGSAQTIANQTITIPLTGFTGTCTILSLHTGPIDLSVLGLNVNLAPIDLVITATAAPGNLLGNLLCAVAHLLDGNTPLAGVLSGLTSLLNQIVGAIRL